MKLLRPAAFALMMTIFTGCGNESAPSPVATPVYVTTIASSDGMEERWLSATVRARIESEIGFRTGGKILKRLVNVGDHVTEGEPLAMLDNADYKLALSAAQKQYKAAEVNARQSLSDAQRFQRLSGDGSMPSAEYERQHSRAEAASAGTEQARSAWEMAKNRYDYTILRAPYNGVVSAIGAEVGQVVAEAQPVVSLAKDDEREAVADLPEEIATSIVHYQADAKPWRSEEKSMPMRLRELAPMAQAPGRTYRARFVPESLDRAAFSRLPLGSTLQLRLSCPAETGVTLPVGSLIKTSDKPGVWAVGSEGTNLEFKKVTVISYGTDTVRVGGLRDNMRIVTVGAQKLDGSMRVSPIERDPKQMDEWLERGRK